jgi:transcription initiation factor TFIIIB Brf1 subunit/transcription initiation factor TFIIB
MVTTILRATAKCPKCGCHDFASPREAPLDADITCLECGYICTVKQALDAEFAEPRPASSSSRRTVAGRA